MPDSHSQSMKRPRWVRRLAIASAAALALVALVYSGAVTVLSAAIGLEPMARCKGHQQFHPSLWQDSAAIYGPLQLRGCMVDDLRRRHRLRGLTREDVVELLGEPRPTGYFRDYDLVYWLGPERGAISIDSEWLVMRLDNNGRVVEERLVTD